MADFAAKGYRVLAPALFDRIERNVSLAYDAVGVARGRALRGRLSWDQVMADISVAIAALDTAKAGLVGYCWGGSIAWIAAATSAVHAAVGYYPRLPRHPPRLVIQVRRSPRRGPA